MTTANGVRASRNMAHMVVDQYFMGLADPMIPVGSDRVQSIADPVGDIGTRLSAVFWSETHVPAAVVVLVGHSADVPSTCDDAWFDAQVAEFIGEQGAAFVALGYDRVVAWVDDQDFADVRFARVVDGAAGEPWAPAAPASG